MSAEILQAIGTIVAVVLGGISMVVALRRAPAQNKADEGQATKSVGEGAAAVVGASTTLMEGMAQQLRTLEKTAQDLRAENLRLGRELHELKKVTADQEERIGKLEQTLARWKEYADALRAQLVGARLTPAAEEPR